MQKLAKEKFEEIEPDQWTAVRKHTEKVREAFLERETLAEEVEELMMEINTGNAFLMQ